VQSLLIGLVFTYPFWGLALLLLFCRWATSMFGPAASRFRKIAVVAPLATALFTPVTYGTEGFATFTHWSMVLIDSRHTETSTPLVVFTLVLSILFSFTESKKRTVVPPR